MAAPNIEGTTNAAVITGGTGGSKVANATSETVGFYGSTGVAKQTVTGARDETEGALANLLTALANLGIITNSTTAS